MYGLKSNQLHQKFLRGGEMAPQLGAHATLVEDLSSLPSIHVDLLTTACNSRESEVSGLYRYPN